MRKGQKRGAKDIQDDIFRKMSAEKKVLLGFQLWELAKTIMGYKIDYAKSGRGGKMKRFLMICCLGLSLWSTALHAQGSIFDEGAEETLKAEDITDDLKLWAQNTALKLQDILKEIKKLNYTQKRAVLLKTIQESVQEARDKRELLLMRFILNRALKLEAHFQNQDDALAVNYVLLPSIKRAIFLYENSDLPYLEANKDKPEGEIESPPYAAFAKSNVGYLLTASNLNKSLEGQFEILKLSVVWTAKDLLRSTQTKRNPINARIILKLKELHEQLSDGQVPLYAITNYARAVLLEAKNKLVEEETASFSGLIPVFTGTGSRPSRFLGVFVRILAGTFMMGSPDSEAERDSDESQHRVTLTQDFEIMTTEVTQRMWFTLMGDNPSYFKERQYCEDSYEERKNDKGETVSLCPDHPVEQVSWDEVRVFIDRLNRKEDGYRYRLPTEAEWECAARAGTQTAYSFGDNPALLGEYAWFGKNSGGQTHPVAHQKQPNAFRLYDMHGNVLEWILDPYSDDYSKALSQQDANSGVTGSGSSRVYRGGNWRSGLPRGLQSADRNWGTPDARGSALGFRLLRTKK